VLGVGEELPFKDNSFDAVFSLAVLEHVKNPFECAAEIARVMKPGAKPYCVVPFLQPQHGYPHHYYNMSSQGLKNLFDDYLEIEKQEILLSGVPIWALNWILASWTNGLTGEAREEFLNMKVADLLDDPISYLDKEFVKQLSREKNFELACTTALFAKKPAKAARPARQADHKEKTEASPKKKPSLLARLFSN
jgi:SAM-dependent methyltransferase